MEGGGGGVKDQRDRRQGQQDEEKAARHGDDRPGGGMKFRVSARAPHGVGALLLIGGAVVAGAAVVAWRHAHARRRRGPLPPPPKAEVSDGGVVEEDARKCGAPAPETDHTPREIDQPDDDNSSAEETAIGPNGLVNGGAAQEIQEVLDDAENVAGEVFQKSERAERVDLDSSSSPAEISMHDDDVDTEHIDKVDQNPSVKRPEVTVHDTMDIVTVEKKIDEGATNENDHNPPKNDTEQEDPIMNLTETGHNQATNDTDTDQDPVMNHTETENSSENDMQKEILAPNVPDKEEVEQASDQCKHSISRPEIVLNKQSLHGDGAQEAESMENSPTAQLMMHPEQLLDNMANDAEEETADEAKLGQGTVSDKDVPEQGQQEAMLTEPVGLAGSPALSTPLVNKPTEKKELELPRGFETGMKIEQDYINGGQKEHGGLVTKGGGGVVAMDRRSSSMAVLALIFALTIGITIIARLYAHPQVTKFLMELQ